MAATVEINSFPELIQLPQAGNFDEDAEVLKISGVHVESGKRYYLVHNFFKAESDFFFRFGGDTGENFYGSPKKSFGITSMSSIYLFLACLAII